MYPQISIRNFGSIRNIHEFTPSKLNIIIGEQASGKTTLAKLIYFQEQCKRVLSDVFSNLRPEDDDSRNVVYYKALKKRFYQLFGATSSIGDFEVKYKFSSEFAITIRPDRQNSIQIAVYSGERNNADFVVWDMLQSSNRREFTLKTINYFGNGEKSDWYYIPAGRLVRGLIKKLNYDDQQPSNQFPYDWLAYDYSHHFESFKLLFQGKSLEDVLTEKKILDDFSDDQIDLVFDFYASIETISKGKYQIDADGNESVNLSSSSRSIKLDFLSTGQQESTGIFGFLLTLLTQRGHKGSVIIEEPEAHLHPVGQRQTMYSLVHYLAANDSNRLFLTTHSPYILSAANNLAKAKKVLRQLQGNQEAANSISEILGISTTYLPELESIKAYELQDGELKSLKEHDDSMIDAGELDEVSEEIADTFGELSDLLR